MTTVKGISRAEFEKRFGTDQSCMAYLAEPKWGKGFECRVCGHDMAYKGKKHYQKRCKKCGREESAIDRISQNKLTTRYFYHHGYWDGVEREFRGFGRVDQFDTETFEAYNSEQLVLNENFDGVSSEEYSPPVYTKNWFNLGPVQLPCNFHDNSEKRTSVYRSI